jgi:small-conductance mechanosensitive channel
VLVRIVRFVLRRVLGHWERADAATAMAGVVIWLLAIGVALSVVAGDARALVGSVGLLGLALSWALQAPIESFAGWLLNSSRATTASATASASARSSATSTASTS